MQTSGIDKAYYLEAGGEITTILSNFNTDFVFDVTDDLMRQRFDSFSTIPKHNFVTELEIGFRDLLNRYPGDVENIKLCRLNTYKEILSRISRNSGVKFFYEADTDIFYLATVVFDLFITNYNNYVFRFLYNFIISQKEYVYNALNLSKLKKSKDISTVYNKEHYEDQQLAIINANLDQCIKFISALDFNTATTLSYIYTSTQEIMEMNYLMQHIEPDINLFEVLIQPLLKNDLIYPSLSTAIKLEIQKNNVIYNTNPQYVKGEE